jgi:hypothetical protein
VLFNLRFVERVSVPDAEDRFLSEPLLVVNAAHDQFQRVRGMIALPYPLRSCLDDGGDQVNDALGQGYASGAQGRVARLTFAE